MAFATIQFDQSKPKVKQYFVNSRTFKLGFCPVCLPMLVENILSNSVLYISGVLGQYKKSLMCFSKIMNTRVLYLYLTLNNSRTVESPNQRQLTDLFFSKINLGPRAIQRYKSRCHCASLKSLVITFMLRVM